MNRALASHYVACEVVVSVAGSSKAFRSGAVVDMVTKRREPLNLAGVYFISASESSVRALIEDFKYKPLYKTAHVFFSSRVPPQAIAEVKNCPGLVSRLKSLKEVGLLATFGGAMPLLNS